MSCDCKDEEASVNYALELERKRQTQAGENEKEWIAFEIAWRQGREQRKREAINGHEVLLSSSYSFQDILAPLPPQPLLPH